MDSCAIPVGAVEMSSPFGNRHHLGATHGTREGAGRPVLRAGTWPRREARSVGKAGQPAIQRGEAGQGPSISYMEGSCLILVGRKVLLAPLRHADDRRDALPRWSAVMTGHGEALDRIPRG